MAKERHKSTSRLTDTGENRQTERQADKHIDRQTEKDRRMGGRTDGWTDR